MKRKLCFAILLFLLLSTGGAKAQIWDGIGIIAGVNENSARYQGYKPLTCVGGQFGLAAKFNLGNGFAVQPELLYDYKKEGNKYILANTEIDKITNAIGYVEVPVMLSWGMDFNGFRVYYFVDPFIGFGVNCQTEYVGTTSKYSRHNEWESQNLRRFEYGFGAGAGVELGRHIQIFARYGWNLGSLCADSNKSSTASDIITQMNSYMLKNCSFNGLQLGVGYFF